MAFYTEASMRNEVLKFLKKNTKGVFTSGSNDNFVGWFYHRVFGDGGYSHERVTLLNQTLFNMHEEGLVVLEFRDPHHVKISSVRLPSQSADECEEVSPQIDELIANLYDEIADKNRQLEEAKRDKADQDSLLAQLYSREDEVTHLTEENNDYERKLSKLALQSEGVESELSRLRREMREATARAKRSETQLERAQVELRQARQDAKQLKSIAGTVPGLQKENRHLKATIEQQDAVIDEYRNIRGVAIVALVEATDKTPEEAAMFLRGIEETSRIAA